MRAKTALVAPFATVCLTLLFLGFVVRDGATLRDVKVSPDVADAYSLWIENTNVRRWSKEHITLAYSGNFTDTDAQSIKQTIAEISQIPGTPQIHVIRHEPGIEKSRHDIIINFSARGQWPSSDTRTHSYRDAKEAGLTVSRWNKNGHMTSAQIYIDTKLSPTQRRRTIAHEILHSLGAGHHNCKGALMYSGVDRNPDWRIPDFDKSLLALSYSDSIPPGATVEDFKSHVVTEPGLECPPLLLESVTSSQGELWCSVAPDVRQCATAGLKDPPSLSAATLWMKDGELYRYDPNIYTSFETPDGRILCYLPSKNSNTPWMACEKTDDNFIKSPSVWTDGTLITDQDPIAP